MINSDQPEMSSGGVTWQEIKLESLVGAGSNLAISQIKILWSYSSEMGSHGNLYCFYYLLSGKQMKMKTE